MSQRNIRPTFLLRLVVLAISVCGFIVVFKRVLATGVNIPVVVALAALWFIAIEIGVLRFFVQRVLAKRYSESGPQGRSIWFVDVDAETKAEGKRLKKASENNPTIQ